MKTLVAEFKKQSFTQIIFPHTNTDWFEYLEDAQNNFIKIINTIILYQKCLVVCDDIKRVKSFFDNDDNLFFVKYKTDDTWARDCSALCFIEDTKIHLENFIFDAWGGKFESKKDNQMSRSISWLYDKELIDIDFILEGGAIESNGDGLILTTTNCISSRNGDLDKKRLKKILGVKEVLYLNHGYLAGDDTDSHIDTLVRFIDDKTLMYVKCEDKNDEHYRELYLMEQELFKMSQKYHFRLVALPMTKAIYFKNKRLPSTYANFLFINGAVLVPVYGDNKDNKVLDIFRKEFKQREIIPIDCQTLIKQNGSLHCVCMNFTKGVDLTI